MMEYRKIVLGDMAGADLCRNAPGDKYLADPVFNSLKMKLNRIEEAIQYLKRFGDLPMSDELLEPFTEEATSSTG